MANSRGVTFPIKNKHDEKRLYYLGSYYKYWIYEEGTKKKNPDFDKQEAKNYSNQILDLKNMRDGSVDFFVPIVRNVLQGEFALCYIPSSNPQKRDSGVRRVAEQIAGADSKISDATDCLVRTKQIPKLAHGGNRDVQTHIDSIKVEKVDLISDMTVVILDDVLTTGNSMKACKTLLKNAGADIVVCLALAHTVKE